MVDVFSEVDEQLRSEQLKTLLQKYLPGVLGGLAAVLLLALAYWGWTAYRQSVAEKASAAYAQGVDSLSHGDTAGAFVHFVATTKFSSPIYRSLALQQEAGVWLSQNKIAKAVDLLDQAAKAAPDPMVADAARLKAAYALMDTASFGDIEARLNPLADPKRPFSALAKEALAFAKLKAGMTSQARSDFVVLTLLASSSDDIRKRAQAAIGMIDDGSAQQLPATVTSALSLSSNPLFPEGPPLGGSAAAANPQPEAAQ